MRIFVFSVMTAALALAQSNNPLINQGGIVNAADAKSPLAPGSLFSIFGSRLSSGTASALTIPLSGSLDGVTVQFINGSTTINAPMLYVQPDSAGSISQINAQVPWDLVTPGSTTTVNVVVNNNGATSAPTPVTIGPFSPGIFASGTQAVAVNYPDGTLAWPAGSVAGLTTHPAPQGSTIILYATGLGAVNQTVTDGAIPSSLATTTTTPVVMIGGVPAVVGFSGLAPQFVGVNQLNIQIPAGAPSGNAVPITIQIGTITSPSNITLAVGN
jgi:uncharacterized protein (TIGR03437 family)